MNKSLNDKRYLTTLYKEFREGIPEKEVYRLVLAEVRDRLLLTKRKYEDLITQASPSTLYSEIPAASGPYEVSTVRYLFSFFLLLRHLVIFISFWLLIYY